MTAITATKAHTPLRSKLVLTLLLAGALLTMGAKWAEKPIESLASISGAVTYTHLRAHETVLDHVCPLLLENKNL